jgi:hypothetical protein
MDRHARVRTLAIMLALAGIIGFVGQPVAAHKHVTVGEYELTVGWRDEPAVAGSLNGLDLGIAWTSNATPVLNAQNDLTVVLSFGSSSVSKDLEPQFGRAGWYTFDVIPTRPGVYSVRLSGTLGATSVDETVDLDAVGPAAALAFPAADPTAGELKAQLDAMQVQWILSIVLGAVGLIVAGVALASRRRVAQGPDKTP